MQQQQIERTRWEGQDRFIRDDKVKGLILKVQEKGLRWAVQRDGKRWNGKKRTVRQTFASASGPNQITVSEARRQATKIIATIIDGSHPSLQATRNQGIALSLTLGQMWEAYEDALTKRGRAPKTIKEFGKNRKYIKDWLDHPLGEITKSEFRERHEEITHSAGPQAANSLGSAARAAYNYTAKKLDDDNVLAIRGNITDAVEFNPSARKENVIPKEFLPTWWATTEKLPEQRCRFHRLNLLSGMRPGSLTSLRRENIDFDKKTVLVPAEDMKMGRDFTLVLSPPMVEMVRDQFTWAVDQEPATLVVPGIWPSKQEDHSPPTLEGKRGP